ncbi:hypothetical protein [Undibacterium sp. TJN19]|uniref:hypothetical protein n=1 Tax=Undibacterium sp. TJN19 TaxID=3413055 RepID=UPI003BF2681E
MLIKYSSLIATMLFASGVAYAQVTGAESTQKLPVQESGKKLDTEWISYRNAYKLMIQFEKYGKPKNLIQNHFQVSSRSGAALPDDLQLTLVSKSMRLNLPLDTLGRTHFPLLKSAYDENAELTVNRFAEQLSFQARLSIIPRADGVYETADLRSACEQALAYLKTISDATVTNKKCVGVKFSYPRNILDTGIKFRNAGMHLSALTAQEGSAFSSETGKAYKTMTIRFDEATEKGQVLTQNPPIAIAPLFE